MGVGGQRHAPAAFTPGKDPLPIVQEAGWAPGPVWTGAGNLAPTGIRSPDRPARSESLYRLSYPGPCCVQGVPRIRIKFAFENLVERDCLQDQGKMILKVMLRLCEGADRTERCHSRASWRVVVRGS